jgi:CRP-like cAMP-binding protein
MRVQSKRRARKRLAFDVKSFLDTAGVSREIKEFHKAERLFSQGALATTVIYIQKGGIKLSVVNKAGKEAVLAILGAGDFFGEECLAGQSVRMMTATAATHVTALCIQKEETSRLLHGEHGLADRFISHMLTKNIRVEEDLIDQLFNSSEKRLARTLLLLARYGKQGGLRGVIPKVSQETLAEMIGTTRSRVNYFMNKFRKMGFIKYNGGLEINSSLLSLVLHE